MEIHRDKIGLGIAYLGVLVMLLFVALIPSVLAEQDLGTFQNGEIIQLKQICADCSYVNITNIYIDKTGTEFLDGEVEMQQDGVYFNYTFNETTNNGKYVYQGHADPGGTKTIWTAVFYINPSGENVSSGRIAGSITLFFFLLVVAFLFVHFTTKVNYEKWYNSILAKYEHRNMIKVIVSSIGYNAIKNRFVWYYLFGLPILLLITDLTYVFGVVSMIDLMQIILSIYWFGFIVVGIFFFGYVQEWVSMFVDDIKNMDFGVSK